MHFIALKRQTFLSFLEYRVLLTSSFLRFPSSSRERKCSDPAHLKGSKFYGGFIVLRVSAEMVD